MFFDSEPKENLTTYKKYLNLICSLSRLFSESNTPFLYYRIAENIFCNAFGADNLSRSDCSIDARKGTLGVGLKTFLDANGKSMQKIAEFNSARVDYKQYLNSNSNSSDKLIQELIKLRNSRINFTKRTYGVESTIYHCVARKENKLLIYETPMDCIDGCCIDKVVSSSETISFCDNKNEYSFNISKSTLFKRFITPKTAYAIEINILNDPLSVLANLFDKANFQILNNDKKEFVILPLYSPRTHSVQIRSGLNQWNASGRTRHSNEVYIPIPIWIHRVFSNFFPPRDNDFNLVLPDKTIIKAKICQDNNKALMSSPNKDLGEWILRKVLMLNEGELLTYERLQILGIDSVKIEKSDEYNFSIDFSSVGTYDKFESENKY